MEKLFLVTIIGIILFGYAVSAVAAEIRGDRAVVTPKSVYVNSSRGVEAKFLHSSAAYKIMPITTWICVGLGIYGWYNNIFSSSITTITIITFASMAIVYTVACIIDIACKAENAPKDIHTIISTAINCVVVIAISIVAAA